MAERMPGTPFDIVARLHGVDVDPLAVATTRAALSLWAGGDVALDTVRVGDHLVDDPSQRSDSISSSGIRRSCRSCAVVRRAARRNERRSPNAGRVWVAMSTMPPPSCSPGSMRSPTGAPLSWCSRHRCLAQSMPALFGNGWPGRRRRGRCGSILVGPSPPASTPLRSCVGGRRSSDR